MSVGDLAGLAVDAALVVIVVEAAVVVARRRLAPGRALGPALANLAAGTFLMLALRAAVAGAGWPWIVAGLALAGAAHAADWTLRRGRGRGSADDAP